MKNRIQLSNYGMLMESVLKVPSPLEEPNMRMFWEQVQWRDMEEKSTDQPQYPLDLLSLISSTKVAIR